VFDIDTTDIEIALNSISNDVKALDEFDVVLDEDKILSCVLGTLLNVQAQAKY
jgi:hypothetical protein